MARTKQNSRFKDIPSKEKAMLVAGWLNEKKGSEVCVIDVNGICPVTEAFVIASATSARHAKGLASYVMDKTAEENFEYLGMEGQREGFWILLDLNDVMVHIFLDEQRHLYNIEGLWAEGELITVEGDA